MSEFENSKEEKKLNTANKISRRDFIGNTLIGSGIALLGAKAPAAFAQPMDFKSYKFKLGKTMPLPLNNLDKSWTGPGGVGERAGLVHADLRTPARAGSVGTSQTLVVT